MATIHTEPTITIPITETWVEKKMREYHLFAFFLHNEDDKDVSDYLSQKNEQLDALTGYDCLIFSFEKPSNWDESWIADLKTRYGSDFDKTFAEWKNETNYTRNKKIKLITDGLGLPYNQLPCMVFTDDLNSQDILTIPFIAKKEFLNDYLRDILTCVQETSKAPQGERLNAMKAAWRKYWMKWVVSEKIKQYAKEFKEWGSIIAETKDTVVKCIDVISPLLKGISTALKAAA